MAAPDISAAKAILLAVQLTCNSDIKSLRVLVSQHPKTLRRDLVLRILLSHLSESLAPSHYVPFLQDLVSEEDVEYPQLSLDASALEGLSNVEASKRVKKLHLLPLLWPDSPADAPTDSLTQFLIHRSIRIDANTGLITQLPALLAPFLDLSDYLRTWTITTVLPLVRLNYDYYPYDVMTISITSFKSLDDKTAINLLLSRTGEDRAAEVSNSTTVGRDLRGLIGPWMYGDTRFKQRQHRRAVSRSAQKMAPQSGPSARRDKLAGWEEVFAWITSQATTSWMTAVDTVEQWDGPGDVDLGGYAHESECLEEEDQQHLEKRYARAALAAVYLIPEASMAAMAGAQQILNRMATLLDLDKMPTLQAAAALLSTVSGIHDILSPKNISYLRNGLLEDRNLLTNPEEGSIIFIHALLISSFLLIRAGHTTTLRRAGELVLLHDEREQRTEFMRLMAAVGNGPKGDDKYWAKARNEILWLRNWGAEGLGEGATDVHGSGVFGRLSREFIEAEILKTLVSNTRMCLPFDCIVCQ